MSNLQFPLKDVLFVFGQWTLMMDSKVFPDGLKPGKAISLFDGDGKSIGNVVVEKLMPSRNPEIVPVQVALQGKDLNMKSVKYFEI